MLSLAICWFTGAQWGTSGRMSLRSGPDHEGIAVARGHQDRAGNTVNELLTHYTSSPFQPLLHQKLFWNQHFKASWPMMQGQILESAKAGRNAVRVQNRFDDQRFRFS